MLQGRAQVKHTEDRQPAATNARAMGVLMPPFAGGGGAGAFIAATPSVPDERSTGPSWTRVSPTSPTSELGDRDCTPISPLADATDGRSSSSAARASAACSALVTVVLRATARSSAYVLRNAAMSSARTMQPSWTIASSSWRRTTSIVGVRSSRSNLRVPAMISATTGGTLEGSGSGGVPDVRSCRVASSDSDSNTFLPEKK